MKHSTTSLLVIALLSGVAWAGSSKISPDLQKLSPTAKANVIVRFTPKFTQQVNHFTSKVTVGGGAMKTILGIVNGASFTMPAGFAKVLALDPDVVYISLDRQVHRRLDNTAAAVNAASAWQSGLSGAGIGIAIIDSGVTVDQDIASRVVYSQDFVGTGTADDYGHSTHVAGIVAGSGYDSSCPLCFRTFKGIAPGANLVNLRVLDANGESSDSMVISAINTAIQLKSLYNIRVINLSLGRPVFRSEEHT